MMNRSPWRPIESAPRDGRVLAGRWSEGTWQPAVAECPLVYPFTHWQPLPEPPTTPDAAHQADTDLKEGGRLRDLRVLILAEVETSMWSPPSGPVEWTVERRAALFQQARVLTDRITDLVASHFPAETIPQDKADALFPAATALPSTSAETSLAAGSDQPGRDPEIAAARRLALFMADHPDETPEGGFTMDYDQFAVVCRQFIAALQRESEAWCEMRCCDDINLSGSLAQAIGELQTDRERLRGLAAPDAALEAYRWAQSAGEAIAGFCQHHPSPESDRQWQAACDYYRRECTAAETRLRAVTGKLDAYRSSDANWRSLLVRAVDHLERSGAISHPGTLEFVREARDALVKP